MKSIIPYLANRTIVCDPILKSTSGLDFLNSDSYDYFMTIFLQKISLITPNLPELQWLLKTKSNDLEVLIPESVNFSKTHNVSFFLKGGHSKNKSLDYLITPDKSYSYIGPEVEFHTSHGTGCRISSGICAGLSLGHDLVTACQLAKNYVLHTLMNNKLADKSWVMSSPGKITNLKNLVNFKEIT